MTTVFVEVMGRNCEFLALNSAIASGAEAAILTNKYEKTNWRTH